MPDHPAPDPAAALSEHLQAAVAGLAATRTRSQILQVVLQSALKATGARRGAALLLDESREHLTRLEWWPAAATELTSESAHIERFLANEALRRSEALFFERAADVQAAFPELHTQLASATLPLLLQDVPLGALVLKYPDAHPFSVQEQQFLQTLAAQCSVALSRQHEQTRLEQHEQRFQRLVEASPVGIAAGNLAGHLILVNDTYLNMFGFTRADFETGQIDWLRLTPPEYLAGDEAAFQRAFATGRSGRYEKEMLTKTGERLPVSVNLIRYSEGESQYVVGYVQDLRPYRSAELALREYSARLEGQVSERTERLEQQNTELEARTRALEGFAELNRDLALDADEQDLIRRAQQLAQSLLPTGFAAYYEPEDGLWRLKSLVGDMGNPELQALVQAGLPFEQPQNLLIPWRTRQPYYQDAYDMRLDSLGAEVVGQLRTTATLPLLVAGELRGIFAFGLNHAQPWTRANKAVLESIALSLGNAIERVQKTRHLEAERAGLDAFVQFAEAVADETDLYALARRAVDVMQATLGRVSVVYYALEDQLWKAKVWSDNLPQSVLEVVREGISLSAPSFARAAASHQVEFVPNWQADTEGVVNTGQYRAAAFCPYFVNGLPQGLLAVGKEQASDWTQREKAIIRAIGRSLGLALERSEAARQLHQRTHELERSNRELEQFAYVASHDLQEPLRSVTSFTDLLLRRLEVSDPKAQQYAQFITEGTERMGQLIQDLLAFSRVAQGREPQPVETAELVGQVIQDLSAQIEAVGAEVSVGPLPPVKADPTQVRQLFQNLIGNALKFTDPARPARVQVSAVPGDQMVRFCVQDNGIGIAPEHYEKIFTIFQRLHRRDEYQGSGIGLSIARRIAERHGGTIWPESTPGQGSAFYFTLPAAR